MNYVTGVVGRGGVTWSCVERNMKAIGIKEGMAQDRCTWRIFSGGMTCVSANA